MNRGEWDELVQRFLHHRNYSSGTREGYTLALKNLAEWAAEEGLDPLTIERADIERFRGFLRARKLSETTVTQRIKNVRNLYTYLVETNQIANNPVGKEKVIRSATHTRDVLSLDQLSRMWDATDSRARIVIGLLGFCGLKREELRDARAQDVHERSGAQVLSLGSQAGENLGYVALPEQLAEEIHAYLNGRRSGFLVGGERNSDSPISVQYLGDVIRRATARAGIKMAVTSTTLTNSLLSIALEYRFSYLSVMRTASRGSANAKTQLLRNVDLPPEEHASVRLGRMLAARSSDDDEMLLRAQYLLADRSQHPAASIVIAAATLERVMREISERAGITITKSDPTLATYASQLRGAGFLTNSQMKTLDVIGNRRNDAAHGWFERVDRSDAQMVLSETRALVTALRTELAAAQAETSAEMLDI